LHAAAVDVSTAQPFSERRPGVGRSPIITKNRTPRREFYSGGGTLRVSHAARRWMRGKAGISILVGARFRGMRPMVCGLGDDLKVKCRNPPWIAVGGRAEAIPSRNSTAIFCPLLWRSAFSAKYGAPPQIYLHLCLKRRLSGRFPDTDAGTAPS